MNRKPKPLLIIGFLLVFSTVGLTGYLLYLVFNAIFMDDAFDFWPFFIVLAAIIFNAQVGSVILKRNAKASGEKKEHSENNTSEFSENSNEISVSESEETQNHYDNLSEKLGGDAWGKKKENKNNETANKSKKKVDPKKIIPAAFFAIVLIVFIIVYQFGGIPGLGIGSSNPEGRWIYDMEVGESIGGIENLTDYWYMEFEEDGTFEIGIKNDGFVEMPQGSGTWTLSDGIIHIEGTYNWSQPINEYFKIKGNKLVDADTEEETGYVRD